jgi:hypothetical protein
MTKGSNNVAMRERTIVRAVRPVGAPVDRSMRYLEFAISFAALAAALALFLVR